MQTPAFALTKTVRTWKLFRGLIWVAAVVAACLCPTLAFGQTNSSWNGGTGNWSTSTDWTPNQVPNNGGGNTYNVTIDTGGTDVALLDIDATINSLVLGGAPNGSISTLEIDPSKSLSVTGGTTVNQSGSLILDQGSTLTVGGTMTNDGTFIVGGNPPTKSSVGALANNGILIVEGTLNLTNQPIVQFTDLSAHRIEVNTSSGRTFLWGATAEF